MTLIWSDVLQLSGYGAAVFEVAAGHRHVVRDWAEHQAVPRSSRREVHSPSVDAWAVLDGGVTAVYGYGLTSLPQGVRVVGFEVFRLLVADLGVEGPADRFPHEGPWDLDELRRRHASRAAGSAAALEQAELLATCHDSVLLRWVAATLLQPQDAHRT